MPRSNGNGHGNSHGNGNGHGNGHGNGNGRQHSGGGKSPFRSDERDHSCDDVPPGRTWSHAKVSRDEHSVETVKQAAKVFRDMDISFGGVDASEDLYIMLFETPAQPEADYVVRAVRNRAEGTPVPDFIAEAVERLSTAHEKACAKRREPQPQSQPQARTVGRAGNGNGHGGQPASRQDSNGRTKDLPTRTPPGGRTH